MPSPKSQRDLPTSSSSDILKRNLSKAPEAKSSKPKSNKSFASKPINWKTYFLNSSSDFQPTPTKDGKKKKEKPLSKKEKIKKKESQEKIQKKRNEQKKKGSSNLEKAQVKSTLPKPSVNRGQASKSSKSKSQYKIPKLKTKVDTTPSPPNLTPQTLHFTSTPSTSDLPIIDPEQLLIHPNDNPKPNRPSRACKNLAASYAEDLPSGQFSTISDDPDIGFDISNRDIEPILSSSSPELMKLLSRPPLNLKTSSNCFSATNSSSLAQLGSVEPGTSSGAKVKKQDQGVS